MDQKNCDILIIDDDPDILKACAIMLRMRLYNVDTARNGYDAKNCLAEKNYNVVLTDLKMPNISGMDLLKDIKSKSPETEVILFTAHGSINEAVEAMKLGAYDFITKPVDINHVSIMIKRCLEKHSLVAEIGGLKDIINLYEASKVMVSETDTNQLISIIVKLASETLHAEAGSLLLYNPKLNNLEVKAASGFNKERIIGKKITLKNLSEDVSADPQLINTVIYENSISSMSIPIITKGNLLGLLNVSRITLDMNFSNEENQLATIFASQIGIALENSKLFSNLKQEKETINQIFTGMRDGAFLLDNNLCVILANPSAIKLFNLESENFLNKPIAAITKSFHSPVSWDTLKASNKSIEKFNLIKYVDQSLFLETRAMKLSQKQSQWLLLMRDVTAERQEEIIKRGFLSFLSRKLKTPLINIINNIKDLIDDNHEEKLNNPLITIENQANTVSDMIDKLIQFTLLETDGYSILQQLANIKIILDESIHMISSLIDISETSITIHDSVNSLPPLWIDSSKIQEMFEYILENAIKHNDKENVRIYISGYIKNNNLAVIKISDNGPGIPEKDISSIFNQFFNNTDKSCQPQNKMGLSLAMAKKIVRINGGDIWVESKPQQGSSFHIALPVAK